METNNINKNTSDKTLHPERKTGFKPSKKLAEFLIRPLQTCKRATLESRKGHSCIATVALLQARLGPFRPVFAPPICVSKIQTTDYQDFGNIAKIAYLHPSDCALQISQAEKPKMNK
ncbi:hypothetical protein HMPREF6485_1232 [Segatella buccae ATCC 33574]|uniref:Uncharacterized protein n=1 Tax=Segatella buccae ATCC 33574 TaxID=873513 RepID=E6K6I3_9BACT|nr:hypothetical protein HMPREF6485_1232 [Segatella buccae ATCC 33574]